MTIYRLLNWDFRHRLDQIHEICDQLDQMLANEPLPLPGETELFDLADMLQIRADELRAVNETVLELLDTLPADLLSEPVDVDLGIQLLTWLSPRQLRTQSPARSLPAGA